MLDKLRVSHTASGHVIFVCGRVTYRESQVFCDFITESLNRRSGEVLVDLMQCEHMDSTFLGCLVMLFKKHGEGKPPHVRFRADQQCIDRLFGPTGLDKILEFTSEPCRALDGDQGIPIPQFDIQTGGRHVMETHRSLADAAPVGAKQFAKVADQVARDLEKPASQN